MEPRARVLAADVRHLATRGKSNQINMGASPGHVKV